MEHDPCFLAYMAGLFDGEGSICIGRNLDRHGARRYKLRVNCVNSCPWPLLELHQAFGGSFITKKAGKWKLPGQKQMYIWDCSGRQALGFVEAVLPYLRIKKEQARLGMLFQQGMRWGRYDRRNPVPLE